jgi:hypothetical protein
MADGALPHAKTQEPVERRHVFQRLGAPAISLSVLAAVLYLLGFVGLYMPIYNHFIADPFTAMHAVAEVSNTVVIGEGIVVFSTPALTAAVSIAVVVITGILAAVVVALLFESQELVRRLGSIVGTRALEQFVLLATEFTLKDYILRLRFLTVAPVILAFGGLVSVLFSILQPAAFATELGFGALMWSSNVHLLAIVACVFLVVLVGWTAGVLFRNGIELTENLRVAGNRGFVIHSGTVAWAVVLCIMMVALAATPPVISASTPPLPWVEIYPIDSDGPTEITSELTSGFLLGHADGSWHVLTVDTRGVDRGEIRSIPNPKVEQVLVREGFGRFDTRENLFQDTR